MRNDSYENQHYSKLIDCPEHPGQHWAILYELGHHLGGMWECPARSSDTHEHDPAHYEVEEVEVDDSHPDRHDGYTYKTYVCGGPAGCGIAIERDVADPAEDRADAIADQQLMEELGK